jgi:hypothetical protein
MTTSDAKFREDIARINAAVFPVDNRVFQVPREALPLLRQADVRVPPPGEQYKVAELDDKLTSGGLTIEQRITVKNVLRSVGLLGR